MVPDVDDTIAEASRHETAEGRTVKICAQCGRNLDPEEWTPTIATNDDEVAVYLFCDETCRSSWQTD